MQTHLSPAQYVIHVFGGVRKTARMIGRNPGAICHWKQPRKKGGCGGDVPGAAQRIILLVAKKHSLDITPGDLVYGRRITIIAAV